MKARPWIAVLSTLVFLNTLFFYGFVRSGTWAVLAVLSILLHRKIGYQRFLAMSVSFLLVTLVLVVVVDRAFKEKIYYRPHEMQARTDWDGFRIYEPGSEIVFEQDHGDLRNLAPPDMQFETLSRRVVFKVDSFGFRNARDYYGQPYVLVGDSFVAGTGNSQEDTLDAQLKALHGIEAYNLGYPGGTTHYAHNIQKFRNEYGGDFQALVFLFEGNDFPDGSNPAAGGWVRDFEASYKRIRRVYRSLFRDTHLYRYTYMAYKSLTGEAEEVPVTVMHLKGRRVAVYNAYIEESAKTDYELPDEIEAAFRRVNEAIDAFFFIPTKYRVYADLWEEPVGELPDTNLEAAEDLGERLGTPVVDLTPAMKRAARNRLQEDDALLYWPDDTHWNEDGIAVAARVVCDTLEDAGCTPPSD